MSYVIAAPEIMTSAASDLATIGSDLSAAHTAAALPTAAVMPAGADEVSAGIAHLLSQYAGGFQALAGQAAAFHQQFVQALHAGAGAYASTEAANAGPLQALAQDLPVPNVAVSVSGFTLVQLGTAQATSGLGIAIALGAHSTAFADGIFNSAFALGPGSDATAAGSVLSGSIFNTASAVGTNSFTLAGNTGGFDSPGARLDTATAIGANSDAIATGGSLDTTLALGAHSTALAGAGLTTAGNGNLAVVLGNNSTANAIDGNRNLAAALGNDLTASAMGGHMTDIVTFLGSL